MKCLNISLPQVKKDLGILTSILGDEKAAYGAIAYNEGYLMDKTSTGEASLAYSFLKAITGKSDRANMLRAFTFSKAFATKFGDWVSESLDVGLLNAQNEPQVMVANGLSYYRGKSDNIIPIFPGHEYQTIDFDRPISDSGNSVRDYFYSNLPSMLSNSDSFGFYEELLGKADKYGVTINPDSPRSFAVGTQYSIGIKDQSFSKIAKEVMQAVLDRDMALMTTSKRNILHNQIDSFIADLNEYAEDPKVLELLQGFEAFGYKYIINSLFVPKTVNVLKNIIPTDNPTTLYEILRDAVLYPMGEEFKSYNEALKFTDSIFGITDENIFESKSISDSKPLRTTADLELSQVEELLAKQIKSSVDTPLGVGSVANYKFKLGTGAWGTTPMLITKKKGKKYTATPLDKPAISDQVLEVLGTEENFNKTGEHYIINLNKNGVKEKVVVLDINNIVNITTGESIEGISEEGNLYINTALKFAQLNTKWEDFKIGVSAKLNVNSGSEGLGYALTTANLTKPDGTQWDKSKFITKSNTTNAWHKKFQAGFIFNGKFYLDVEAAYQSNKNKYPISEIITVDEGNDKVRKVSTRDLFMEDLLFLKFVQYPELFTKLSVEVDKQGDSYFKNMSHNTTKEDNHWESSSNGIKRDNGFVTALRESYYRYVSFTEEGNSKVVGKISVGNFLDVIQGRDTSIEFKTANPKPGEVLRVVSKENPKAFTFVTVVSSTKTSKGLNRVEYRINTEGESIYSSLFDVANVALAKEIQVAMQDTKTFPTNVSTFARRLEAIIESNTAEDIGTSDYATALPIMQSALDPLGEPISEGYYGKLYEVIQQLYVNRTKAEEKTSIPTKKKGISEFNTSDIIYVQAGNAQERDDAYNTILNAVADKASTFILPLDKFATPFEQDIIATLRKQGSKEVFENGVRYFLVPVTNIQVADDTIVEEDPTELKEELVPKQIDFALGKVITVSFSNKEDKVTANESGNTTNIQYKNTVTRVNSLFQTAVSTPGKDFFINTKNKSILDKIFKTKLSNGGYPSNFVFTETALEYLNTKEDVQLKENITKNPVNNYITLGNHSIDLNNLGITFTLSQEQEQTLNNFVAWESDINNKKAFSIEGLAGTGKQQPVDCLVQTPEGPKELGSLKTGDYVFGIKGTPIKVTGVYPQGIKQAYKVTFRDKSFTEAGEEHLWDVWTTKLRANKRKPRTMSTAEIISGGIKYNSGNYKYIIPLCDPVIYNKVELPLNPYMLGALIGDGTNLGITPIISTPDIDKEIIDYIEKVKPDYTKINPDRTSNCPRYRFIDISNKKSNRLNLIFKSLKLNVKSIYRFIPEIYKRSSIQQRYELLKGLMDTDGTSRGNRISFSTSSKQLMLDMLDLVQSLGGIAILQELDTRYDNINYTLNIKVFKNPFKLTRKAKNWKFSTKNPPSRYISSIEKSRVTEQVCISVDAEDGLYLTDGYIVTHNTTILKVLQKYLSLNNKPAVFSALTHVAVINMEVMLGSEASTLHSLLSLRPDINIDSDTNFSDTINEESLDKDKHFDSIIFIDEISLASEALTSSLIDGFSNVGSKVVIIGNDSQLPKVGSTGNSFMIDKNKVELNQLRDVKRQSKDNPAILFQQALAVNQGKKYNSVGLEANVFFNHNTNEGFQWIPNRDQFFDSVVKAFREDRNNIMHVRLLTNSNLSADVYNSRIRRRLLPNIESNLIVKDDITFFTETMPDEKIRQGLPYRAVSAKTFSTSLTPGSKLLVPTIEVQLEPGINYFMGGKEALKPVTTTVINAKSADDPTIVAAVQEYAEYVNNLRLMYINLKKYSTNFNEVHKALNRYLDFKGAFAFMFDVTISHTYQGKSRFRKVIPRNFSYGYASTTHKTQSLEFDKVFIDEINFVNTLKNVTLTEKEKAGLTPAQIKTKTKIKRNYQYNKLLYTAVTRAKQQSYALISSNRLARTEAGKNKALAIANQIQEDSNSFEYKTFEDSYGNKSKQGSFQNRLSNLVEETTIPYKENVISISTMSNGNKKEKALFEIAMSDIIYNDFNNLEVVDINNRLWNALVTSETDSKILPGWSMKMQNQHAYDMYQSDIMAAVYKTASTFPVDGMEDNLFELKTSDLIKNLSTEIRNLQRIEQTLKNEEASISDIQDIQDEIEAKTKTKFQFSTVGSIDQLERLAQSDIKFIQSVLSKDVINHSEFIRARQKIDLWKSVGDFTDKESNPFLSYPEADDPGIQAKFERIAEVVNDFNVKLDTLGSTLFTADVSDNLGDSFTFNDILKLRSKVSLFIKNLFSIAKVDNPIVAHVMKLINVSQKKANIKAITDSKRLADLHAKTEASGFNPVDMYQTTAKGGVTGRLINEYSYEYSKFMNIAKTSVDGMDSLREANVVIDINKLFKLGKAKYIQSLGKFLDVEVATKAVEEAESKFNSYVEMRESFVQDNFGISYSQKSTLDTADQRKLKTFENAYDPIKRIESYKTAKSYWNLAGDIGGDRFITVVPKQKAKDSKTPTEWYDKKFSRLQKNPDAFAYWTMASQITKRSKLNYNISGLSEHAIGLVDRSLIDIIRDNGVSKMTLKSTAEAFMKSITSKKTVENLDDTKRLERDTPTMESAIKDEMFNLRQAKYPTLKSLNEATWKQLFEEASANIVKDSKLDIFMALNSLNLSSLSFAYKSAIKPQIDVAMHYLKQLEAGNQRDPKANAVAEKDVLNAIDMTNYFVDKELYNISSPDRSYKLGITHYNTKDKARREEIVQTIDGINQQEKLSKQEVAFIEELQIELDNMGENVTVDSVISAITNYMRFVTLGWNINNAIANLGQGQVANLLYAAEGDSYDFSDLTQAGKIMLGDRSKFKAVMSNYAMLGDITYSFEKSNPFKKKSGILGRIQQVINPYEEVRFTEELNQGMVIVSMMLHEKMVDTNTGELISMWDAIDSGGILADNYEATTGRKGSDAVANIANKIAEQVNVIHGDYSNPVKLSEGAKGKAVLLFKKYFFEPYLARFGAKRRNYLLKKDVSGFYVTAFNVLKDYGINYSQFLNDVKEGKVSDVDYKNIRKMFTEITVGALAFILAGLTKMALCDDLANCSGAEKYIINTLNRIDGEVRMFNDPDQWYNFISNPVAATKYLKDLDSIIGYTSDWARGDLQDQFGENPIWTVIKKDLPLIRRIEIEKGLTEYIHD